MELKIDNEFETKIPPLTKEELEQLEENILVDGAVYTPILVWDGTIIDGHNRYRIVQKHPEIPYSVRNIVFKNRNDALSWICENQLGRRNLTPAQKKVLVGTRYEAEKASHGGNRRKVSSDQNEHLKKDNTRQKLAKELGKSESYVQRCIDYSRGIEAGDEVYPGFEKMVFAGKLKLKDREVEKIWKLPKEKRAAYVRSLVEGPAEPAIDRDIDKESDNPEEPDPLKNKKKAAEIALPVKEPLPLLSNLEDAMLDFWKAWKEETELHKDLLRSDEYCDEICDLIEECRNFLEDYEKKYL